MVQCFCAKFCFHLFHKLITWILSSHVQFCDMSTFIKHECNFGSMILQHNMKFLVDNKANYLKMSISKIKTVLVLDATSLLWGAYIHTNTHHCMTTDMLIEIVKIVFIFYFL